MSDTTLDAAHPAPDWSTQTEELTCPLCNYNLRGLVEPRCPECGFAFTWNELLNERRNQHPYLFEHQPKHNIWSFWKTFWADYRPQRFWREVSPANPIRLRRLLIYWLLANSAIAAMIIAPMPATAWYYYKQDIAARSAFRPVPGTTSFALPYSNAIRVSATQLNTWYPPPSTWLFWDRLIQRMEYSGQWVLALASALLWPWLTFASLLIFQASMRRARIRQSHVLRTVVYSCDFPLLLAAACVVVAILRGGPGGEPLAILMLCPLIVLHRLGIAYKHYLRFDRPFLTVLASQVIVFLAVFCLLLNANRI